MKKFLIIVLFLSTNLFGQTYDVLLPKTVKMSVDEDEYKNLQWNRYTTKNFTVISIDNREGEWLSANLDRIKEDCTKKWGIINSTLSSECRIMVVNNKNLFKKFFNLSEPKVEFRKKDDKTDIIGVWLCIENNDRKDLNKVISQICFQDMLDKKKSSKKFLEQGIAILSQNTDQIMETLKDVSSDISFLNKSEEDYKKLSEEDKKKFEISSAAFCLMLKKEFGENKFLRLMFSKGDHLNQIIDIYQYKDKEEVQKVFNRFCSDLKNSIQKNSINNRYFKVERLVK